MEVFLQAYNAFKGGTYILSDPATMRVFELARRNGSPTSGCFSDKSFP